jgi:hypothetical protein
LSRDDAHLLGRASRLLWNRDDPLGALFAAQAAMVAEPVWYHWEWLDFVAERLGRPGLAGTPPGRESSAR